MIWALQGRVHVKRESLIVVEVHGVFYEVLMTTKDLERVNLNDEIKVYVREVYKENSVPELVGFLIEEDRMLYDSLISVNGIGSRNALKIMEVTDYESFANAVSSRDISFLKTLPSVGEKTAERIVLELSGKLKKLGGTAVSVGEAVETMIALGFSRTEALRAVNAAVKSGSKDLEGIVKTALSLVRK